MSEFHTLINVFNNEFYPEIWEAVSFYIENNPSKLDCNANNILSPKDVQLLKLNMEQVNVSDSVGCEILLDLVVSTEIKIIEPLKKDVVPDNAIQWFKISCKGELDDGIKNFLICKVDIYNRLPNTKKPVLANLLLPKIRKEQFDSIADEFLKRFFPEALESPMEVSAVEIAKRMGLKIREANLSHFFTLFGELVFGDVQVSCKCQAKNRPHIIFEKPANPKNRKSWFFNRKAIYLMIQPITLKSGHR